MTAPERLTVAALRRGRSREAGVLNKADVSVTMQFPNLFPLFPPPP